MTTTRKYYNELLSLFDKIVLSDNTSYEEYYNIKKDLLALINRVKTYNLFALTFSQGFIQALSQSNSLRFSEEKHLIIKEMYFELNECLHVTRLRYGGELIQYSTAIKLSLLKWNIADLSIFEKNKINPQQYYLPMSYDFKSIIDKDRKIRDLKKLISSIKVKNARKKISKIQASQIEESLKKQLSEYKDYINNNYPSISDQFNYHGKLVCAYITESISSSFFELRIHSYRSTALDSNIIVNKNYYDFYPSYSYNLEEISENLVTLLATRLDALTLEYTNPFSVTSIHNNLISFFLQNATEIQLIDFLAFLIKSEKHRLIPLGPSDYPFDLRSIKDGKENFIEFFHTKSRTLEIVLEKIERLKHNTLNGNVIFAFSTSPGKTIIETLKKNNINFIMVTDLINHYRTYDTLVILHWYIKSVLDTIKVKTLTPNSFEGETLITRLKECPCGEANWKDYEEIGEDIFKYLFADNFNLYLSKYQSENDLKNHRRDLLISNLYKTSTSFWADVKLSYRSNIIIVDFKNYTNKLNSNTVYDVSKYMNDSIGYFALVFSRKGIDSGAQKQLLSLLNEKKLILEFSDEDLIEMIKEKIIGKDPIDRLQSKKFMLQMKK